MADQEQFEIRASALPTDAVIDEGGNLNVAFLQVNMETFQINLCWLPELFRRPMPKTLRDEIAKRLRIHADKLQSGEMERLMANLANVNDPETHD